VKKVLVRSKQLNVLVKKTSPSFRYRFNDVPVEMPLEHAEVICKSPMFEIVGDVAYDAETDLNRDGVNDAKDVSLAAKVMAKSRKKKKKTSLGGD